ncbi:MAG: prepilin peptidase [Bacilli bacterium]|nr:prepilin peptidase [Bacilli bacterium]
MEIFIYGMLFIFGSVIGSFLNVLAVRLSNNESILWPSSHCHNCQHKLKWYELIPVVSYLIQGGKSRCCRTKIPLSYLVIEIITGILYMVSYHSFGFSYEFAISLIFISSLIIIIVSDIEYMIILDEVVAIACISIVTLQLIFFGLDFTANKIISGILAFATMYIIKIIGDKLFKKESMGGGDIKLMFLFGIVIGYLLSICDIFLATFIAFPVAIYMLFSKKDNLIPFGPFLAMSAILIHISKVDIESIINFFIK